MAQHFVYILECADQSFYVGSSTDPELRLEYHQTGRGGAYTSKRLPVKLIFTEPHSTLEGARAREKQIKRWSHEKKAALIAGDREALHRLSRPALPLTPLLCRPDPSDTNEMLRAGTLALLLTTITSTVAAQDLQTQLRQAEEQLAQALTTKDAAALERLLAANFVMRGAPDVVRDTWLKNALTLCWGKQFEISDFALSRATGDLAIVTLLLTTQQDPVTCEPAIIRSLLTDIWIREAGAWRLAVRHSGPAAAAVSAQFAKVAPPPPRWERTGELSLVSTGGNTDTQTLGASAGVIWRPGQWTTRARAAFVRSSTQDAVTAESFVGELRQARVLSPRADLFARAEYLVDRFSGISRRTTVDGGIGWLVFDDGRWSLKTDGALGVTRENRLRGDDLTFASASGIALFKWTITPTAALTEQVTLSTDVSDTANWRLQNGLNLTLSVNRILSARIGHELKRINRPVAGFRPTDTVLSAALVARF